MRFSSVTLARTKETARKSTGGKAPTKAARKPGNTPPPLEEELSQVMAGKVTQKEKQNP